MRIINKKRLFLLILSILFIYFLFHAIYGNRGLLALIENKNLKHNYESELNELTSTKKQLEHKVKLMSPESIDKDMLDEQVRKILGTSDPDEIIIVNEEEQ